MPWLRIALISTALVLAGAIILAGLNANLWTSFGRIIADPWGVVTLVDLYAGFLVAGVVIWCVEPRKGLAVVLILLTPFLGNLVTLPWLALRGLPILWASRA
jgi:hypothetical protein